MITEVRIIWSQQALNDIADIHNYIAYESSSAASKLIGKILNIVENLKFFPLMGQIEPNLQDLGKEYRYLLCSNCKIIYREENHTIFIITIFDCRRDPLKISSKI